ncbi:MAG: hypothetical protein HZA01_04530 [Nitrospinae bacterium]|nr:hypothetical protein [Nitrospinota bacterium]
MNGELRSTNDERRMTNCRVVGIRSSGCNGLNGCSGLRQGKGAWGKFRQID